MKEMCVSPRHILIFWETRAFTNMVSGPAGNLCFWPSKQQTHQKNNNLDFNP